MVTVPFQRASIKLAETTTVEEPAHAHLVRGPPKCQLQVGGEGERDLIHSSNITFTVGSFTPLLLLKDSFPIPSHV